MKIATSEGNRREESKPKKSVSKINSLEEAIYSKVAQVKMLQKESNESLFKFKTFFPAFLVFDLKWNHENEKVLITSQTPFQINKENKFLRNV